jgi:hypothetical protein
MGYELFKIVATVEIVVMVALGFMVCWTILAS